MGRSRGSRRVPEGWSAVSDISLVEEGVPSGVGPVYRAKVRGKLPITFAGKVAVLRREPPRLIELQSRGDFVGIATWELSEDDGVTTATLRWDVRTTKPWMNLTAGLLHGLFAANHKKAMDAGGRQLSRYLGARLLSNQSWEQKAGPVRGSPLN